MKTRIVKRLLILFMTAFLIPAALIHVDAVGRSTSSGVEREGIYQVTFNPGRQATVDIESLTVWNGAI